VPALEHSVCRAAIRRAAIRAKAGEFALCPKRRNHHRGSGFASARGHCVPAASRTRLLLLLLLEGVLRGSDPDTFGNLYVRKQH
jgi:hypothetical protein